MKYLVSRVKHWKKRAHLWDGADTFCRMYLTGGLRQDRYEVADTHEGKPICLMCSTQAKWRNYCGGK